MSRADYDSAVPVKIIRDPNTDGSTDSDSRTARWEYVAGSCTVNALDNNLLYYSSKGWELHTAVVHPPVEIRNSFDVVTFEARYPYFVLIWKRELP